MKAISLSANDILKTYEYAELQRSAMRLSTEMELIGRICTLFY